jgi:GH24 family phage-related lysozyme (muramidase)
MIGPTKRPQDFGFKQGDTHIIVNDIVETAKAYDFSGKLLWEIPALARGQGSDIEFRVVRTDTPPGLYKLGTVYKDFERVGANPAFDRTLAAYGWYSFDMNELEGQVSKYGRSGIMIHGGGSAAGWPGAWAPKQPLFATHGCVRIYNIDLRDKILPLYSKGTVYISVYQEANPAIKPPVVSKPETVAPKPEIVTLKPETVAPKPETVASIKFTDAAKFYKEEPQQVDAFNYLEENTVEEVKREFEKRYRNSNKQETNTSTIPKEALDIIKEFEGFSSKAYYDPHTGSLPIIIGYGSTRKMDGTPFYIVETITREEGEKLLIYQLNKEFIPSLQRIPYWNEMNNKMRSSLISFAYNLGANFYNSSGFNTITRVLKEKKWNEVPNVLELYRNPGSKVEAGLLRRRRREGLLWQEGLKEIGYK